LLPRRRRLQAEDQHDWQDEGAEDLHPRAPLHPHLEQHDRPHGHGHRLGEAAEGRPAELVPERHEGDGLCHPSRAGNDNCEPVDQLLTLDEIGE
jgi:hypothetical protein